MNQLGRALLVVGVAVGLVGLILAHRLGLGRLPGDVVFKGKHVTVYWPLMTSIIVSLLLTLLLNLWLRRR